MGEEMVTSRIKAGWGFPSTELGTGESLTLRLFRASPDEIGTSRETNESKAIKAMGEEMVTSRIKAGWGFPSTELGTGESLTLRLS
jgi:uncharacterized protein YhjY with autotransporter beta-barrel domain